MSTSQKHILAKKKKKGFHNNHPHNKTRTSPFDPSQSPSGPHQFPLRLDADVMGGQTPPPPERFRAEERADCDDRDIRVVTARTISRRFFSQLISLTRYWVVIIGEHLLLYHPLPLLSLSHQPVLDCSYSTWHCWRDKEAERKPPPKL